MHVSVGHGGHQFVQLVLRRRGPTGTHCRELGDVIGHRRSVSPTGYQTDMCKQDSQIPRLTLKDLLEQPLGFARVVIVTRLLELLCQGETSFEVVGAQRGGAAVVGCCVVELTSKPRKLALKKRDLSTIGGQGLCNVELSRRCLVVAEPDVGHGKVGSDRRLCRGEYRRLSEL